MESSSPPTSTPAGTSRTLNCITATYTKAEFASDDANSADPESIFSGGADGNDAPYIPDVQLRLGAGVEFARWGAYITGTYVDESFTSGSNTDFQIDTGAIRMRTLAKRTIFFLLDFSAYLQLKDHMRVIGGVQNATDDDYVATRQPEGSRPGQPLFAYLGLELDL